MIDWNKRIYFDAEVFENYWEIDFKLNGTHHVVETRKELMLFLEEHKNGLFIGFNNFHYDDIVMRLILAGKNPFEANNFDVKDINGKPLTAWQRWPNLTKLPVKTLDLMEDLEKANEGKIGFRLKDFEGNIGESIEEYDFTSTIIKEEEKAILIEYNKHDVDMTEKLAEMREADDGQLGQLISNKKNLVETMGMEYESTSTAQQLGKFLNVNKLGRTEMSAGFNYQEPQFLKELLDHNTMELEMFKSKYICDTLKTSDGFKTKILNLEISWAFGGGHASVEHKVYESNDEYVIYDIDATSFYPFIMANPTNEELRYHSRQIKDWHIIHDWIVKRVSVKKTNKPLATVLKLIINKIFGMSGSKVNSIYDFQRSKEICITGQLLIASMIYKLIDHGIDFNLIQVNTDGFTIYVKRSLTDEIRNILDFHTFISGIIWEDTVMNGKFIIQNVNNYIYLEENKIKKAKGHLTAMNNWHNCTFSICNECLLNYYLGTKTIMETIHDAIEKKEWLKFANVITAKSHGYEKVLYGDKEMSRTNRVFVTNNLEYDTLTKVKNGVKNKFALIGERQIVLNTKMDESWDDILRDNLDIGFYAELANKNIKSFA